MESEVDEIDKLLTSDKTEEPCCPLEDCMYDLNTFFVEELKCGDGVKEEVAKIINKSLRCPPDANKLQERIERNKRPENVTNLQVPRVDSFLWDQLKGGTKSRDVAKQKTIAALNQALVPLIRALNHITGNKSPDVMMLKNYIGDSVKLMCGEVHKINMQRQDTIKKELFPKFKTLCSEDQPVSPTGLFGDDLADKSKSLDTSKSVQMTPKGKTFLFKRGGERTADASNIGTPPPTNRSGHQKTKGSPLDKTTGATAKPTTNKTCTKRSTANNISICK